MTTETVETPEVTGEAAKVTEEQATPAKEKAAPVKVKCQCSQYSREGKDENGEPVLEEIGCLAETSGKFAPGHDAKLKSFLIKAGAEGLKVYKTGEDGQDVEIDVMSAANSYGFGPRVASGIERAKSLEADKAAKAQERADAKQAAADKKAADKQAKADEKAAAKLKADQEKADKKAAADAAKAAAPDVNKQEGAPEVTSTGTDAGLF